MACVKKPRTRSTVDDKPGISLDTWSRTTRISTGATLSYVETPTRVVVPHRYSKSISDFSCQLEPVYDSDGAEINPCKGKDAAECRKALQLSCADCVKQSKHSFNFVSSVTRETIKHFGLITMSRTDTRRDQKYEVETSIGGTDPESFKGSIHLPPKAITALELSDAMRDIAPSVEKYFRGSTTNIYETLFELNQLKKLLDLFKVNNSRTPVTDRYLGFSFGYVPLISVIEDVLTILIKLDNIIDTWNDFVVNGQTMNFHGNIRTLEDEGDFINDVALAATPLWKGVRHNVTYAWKDVAKLHLYIKPHMIPGDLRYRVLLKALGIDKPIAGLWELIPYSWLVDYFVNVDDMIARWETGINSMFQFDVVSLGYSMRREVNIESRTKYQLNPTGYSDSHEPNKYTATSFERHPLPASALRDAIIPTTLGWADGPGGKQVTYMVAVARGVTASQR